MYRKPYRVKRRKPIFKNRFFWFGILFLFLIGSFLYLTYFAQFFQIKTISISGNNKVQAQELEKTIREKVVKNIVFFKTQSIFSADSEEIAAEIIKDFPQIEKVSLQKKLPSKLVLLVEERKPAATLCQEKRCFFVDKNGIVYEEISETNYQGPKIKNQTLLSEIKLGENAVIVDLMGQILKINSKLSDDLKIALQEFDMVSEQRLNVKTASGWEIYFNLKGDIDWQITELKTILENKIPPKNWKNLEYIDLRFDRVFVSPTGLISN
jgi:cell division septal protein FtsQ